MLRERGLDAACRLVALPSSRLPRRLEPFGMPLCCLRAAMAGQVNAGDVVLIVPGTAAAPWAERCAKLAGRRTVRIWGDPSDPSGTIEICGDKTLTVEPSPWSTLPALDGSAAHIPAADRLLVALADLVVPWHVRRGGYVHRLLQHRLNGTGHPRDSIRLASGGAIPRRVRDELLAMGAMAWELPAPATVAEFFRMAPAPSASAAAPGKAAPAAARTDLPAARGPWLSHCTRACAGPWPGQSETEYLDDLILARPSADHSPLAALRRIVERGRLDASSLGIRGGHAVVSFTAVPVDRLSELHTFRPHRQRWDFEPYGISVARDWLEGRGARPVLYGGDREWNRLAAADRPFFQFARSRRRSRRSSVIDWTVEQEWRHAGDLPLDDLPPWAAMLFVPTMQHAQELVSLSRWPVAVLAGTPT
jgi:hypothetical protein